MAEQYRAVARVSKARGKRGEVVAVPVDGLPPLLRVGLEVALVPPPLRGSRWHVVSSVESGPRGQLVRLSGADGIGAAERLVGKTVLARSSDLPPVVRDVEALLGREVVGEGLGELGRIVEVMTGPANDVWVVDGPHGELLLPVIEQVVSDVPEEGAIVVRVPAGILDDGGKG